jgi:transposase
MPTSPTAVLRRIKAAAAPTSKKVTQVGVDDWAFRRGLKYGTILVDLETHRVVDLLPDRAVATAAAWFKEHPDIEVISRDRGVDYATAANGKRTWPLSEGILATFWLGVAKTAVLSSPILKK